MSLRELKWPKRNWPVEERLVCNISGKRFCLSTALNFMYSDKVCDNIERISFKPSVFSSNAQVSLCDIRHAAVAVQVV